MNIKFLKENGDKLGDNAKPLELAAQKAREAMKGDDLAALKRATQDLQQAMAAAALATFALGVSVAGAQSFPDPKDVDKLHEMATTGKLEFYEKLRAEFPALAEKIQLRTPDEKDKRHGQAVAAAGA